MSRSAHRSRRQPRSSIGLNRRSRMRSRRVLHLRTSRMALPHLRCFRTFCNTSGVPRTARLPNRVGLEVGMRHTAPARQPARSPVVCMRTRPCNAFSALLEVTALFKNSSATQPSMQRHQRSRQDGSCDIASSNGFYAVVMAMEIPLSQHSGLRSVLPLWPSQYGVGRQFQC